MCTRFWAQSSALTAKSVSTFVSHAATSFIIHSYCSVWLKFVCIKVCEVASIRKMGTIFSDVLRRNKCTAKRGHVCLMSAGFPFSGYHRFLARLGLFSQLEFCTSSHVLSLVTASLSARIHTLSQSLEHL